MSFFQNTHNPKGFGGKIMLNMMNYGHSSMADWGFSHLRINPDAISLDIGCGGGFNVKKLLLKSPKGKVTGVDYSDTSIEKSIKVNKDEIKNNRCQIIQANVINLPFEEESFDLVTAFETVYFWPDIEKSFEQVYKVLRKDGTFMICNESNGKNPKDNKWTDIIDGMTIYNAKQLNEILLKAGFKDIKAYTNKKSWLCMIAKK